MSYKCISLDEAQHLLDSPETIIVDIRDKQSYEIGNIPDQLIFRKRILIIFWKMQKEIKTFLYIVMLVIVVREHLNILFKRDLKMYLV